MSTGFVQAFSPGIDGIGGAGGAGVLQRVGSAALLGGVASKLVGGSFSTGARLGAFSRFFNDEHPNIVKAFKWVGKTIGRAFGLFTHSDDLGGGIDSIIGIENDVSNGTRTGNANKTDANHKFPDMIDNHAGEPTRQIGADGKPYVHYSVEGSLNGTPGEFQWIVNPETGAVTHRYFNSNQNE